ncbi:DUF523 domain-containing protein [bacterium]|nr:DUF523 domain-containing protein [bacterium]
MHDNKSKAIVSACLLGICCRYDGKHKLSGKLGEIQNVYDLVPVCPEQMGGMPTPRPPSMIVGGEGKDVLEGNATVTTDQGSDVTMQYINGAQQVLSLVQLLGIKKAFLKSNSPSCGCGAIKVDGIVRPGDGVTTALLKRHGIDIESVD